MSSSTSPAPAPSTPRAYWSAQAVGWGLYVALTIAQLRAGAEAWSRSLEEPLLLAVIGVAITHAFRAFARANRWGELEARALLPRLVAASIALATVLCAIASGIEVGVWEAPLPAEQVMFAIARWTLVFFTWTALYFGTHLLRDRMAAAARRRELEAALQTSELQALKAQLNPHFLFNALNAVRALIPDEPARAQEAITQLARMLRYALRSGKEDLVTFDQELGMVDDYLGLEALRLGNRLRVERDVRPAVMQAKIPVMTLQIMVENAIKHGIAELPLGGTLRLTAQVVEETLEVTVENPRPKVKRETGPPGIGLANASTRLRLLTGPLATLDVDLSVSDRATARARVPQVP